MQLRCYASGKFSVDNNTYYTRGFDHLWYDTVWYGIIRPRIIRPPIRPSVMNWIRATCLTATFLSSPCFPRCSPSFSVRSLTFHHILICSVIRHPLSAIRHPPSVYLPSAFLHTSLYVLVALRSVSLVPNLLGDSDAFRLNNKFYCFFCFLLSAISVMTSLPRSVMIRPLLFSLV